MAQGVDLSLAPKPDIQVEFKIGPRGEHLYGARGKWYPSVTKILGQWDNGKSAGMSIWARREALKMARAEIMKFSEHTSENSPALISISEAELDLALEAADRTPDDIRDRAGDIGNDVHHAVDTFILTGRDPETIPEHAKRGYGNFREWHAKSGITIISPDVPVVNIHDGYGGRMDSMGLLPNKALVAMDWKTSNKIRDSYAAQLGGYMLACTYTFGINFYAGVIVRFNKETSEVEAKWVDPGNARAAFYSVLNLFKASQKKLWLDIEPNIW